MLLSSLPSSPPLEVTQCSKPSSLSLPYTIPSLLHIDEILHLFLFIYSNPSVLMVMLVLCLPSSPP
jgi:hypothetical protein